MVWTYEGPPHEALRILLGLMHPAHPDAPSHRIRHQQACTFPAPSNPPMTIQPPSQHGTALILGGFVLPCGRVVVVAAAGAAERLVRGAGQGCCGRECVVVAIDAGLAEGECSLISQAEVAQPALSLVRPTS